MASIKTRIQPITRDVQLMIDQNLSPAAQSRQFAALAGQEIEVARNINRQVLGRVPPETITVDGRKGAPLESVRPNGVIIAEWEVFVDVLVAIGQQLEKHSPKLSGRYASSHELFADGQFVPLGGSIPLAEEYVFVNVQPYARKIEAGRSSQAPDGVYQAIPSLPEIRKFNNLASITFGYRTPMRGAIEKWAKTASAQSHAARYHRTGSAAEWLRRQPAIIVRQR